MQFDAQSEFCGGGRLFVRMKGRFEWLSEPVDVELTVRCAAPVLITANSAPAMVAAARQIHVVRTGERTAPFVQVPGGDLPSEGAALQAHWTQLLRAAVRGSLFIPDVEAVALPVQNTLAQCIRGVGTATVPLPVYVIAGTTVPLFERVKRGQFSEDLFYRLNCIHLHVAETIDEPMRC